MSREYLILLPWPEPPLWENRKAHWAERAKAKKSARQAAWALCKGAGVGRHDGAVLIFSYHPPTRGKRDAQNMPATLKASIDGIADAMGCDDANFQCVFPTRFDEVVKGGAVACHIKPGLDEWQQIGDLARNMVRGSVA